MEVELPDYAEHVADYFWSLHLSRGSNGMAPGAITDQTLYYFKLNRRIRLREWEIRAIFRMEAEFWKHYHSSKRQSGDE